MIWRKVNLASVNRARVWEHSEPLSEGYRGWSPLRKFFGSKEHLEWYRIDLNAAKIFTVQDYKHIKN